MRKVLRNFCVGLFICLGCRAVAQNYEALSGIDEFTFYGVDYRLTRVLGAGEAPSSFVKVFGRINMLMINEPKKYCPGKKSKKKVKGVSLSAVNERNETIDPNTLVLDNTNVNTLTMEQIQEEIKALPIKETEGVGLVLLAELLDKTQATAHYHVVYFDVATRNIIVSWEATGKAGGIALRNYWANSLVKVLRNT